MAEDDNKVTSLGDFRKEKKAGGIQCEECGTPTEELIYVCTNCQCRTWYLKANGGISCSSCDNSIHPDEDDMGIEGWRRVIDTAPTDPETIAGLDDDKGTINNHNHGTVSFARRNITRQIVNAEKNDELMFAGAYKKDGYGFWWSGANDAEDRDWVVGKMREMADHMERLTYEGENARTPDEA